MGQPKLKRTHTIPLKTSQKLKPPPPHTSPYKPQPADSLNSQDKAQQQALLSKQTQLAFPPNKLKTRLTTKKPPRARLTHHTPTQPPLLTLKQQSTGKD